MSTAGKAALLAVTTVLIGVVAAVVAFSAPPQYVSTASILVGPVSSDVDTLRASQALTSTYSQLLLSPQAVRKVADGVHRPVKEVSAAADVTFNTDTRIVSLTVTTAAAKRSADIASALVDQLTRMIGTIAPTAPGAATVLSTRPPPVATVRRSPVRYAIIASVGWILLALGIGAALAAARPTPGANLGELVALRPERSPTPHLSADDVELIADSVTQRLLTTFVDDTSRRAGPE